MQRVLRIFQTLTTLELYDASMLNKSDPRVYLDNLSSNTTSIWAGNFSALLAFIALVTSTIETLRFPCNWILRDRNGSTIITLPKLTRWKRLRRLIVPQAALNIGLESLSDEKSEDEDEYGVGFRCCSVRLSLSLYSASIRSATFTHRLLSGVHLISCMSKMGCPFLY